jgi:uncharacterized protein YqgC (DUF456 family)
MDWISIVILVIFALYASICVLITLVGLPGTWLMLAGALVVMLCNPLWSDSTIWSWTAMGIALGLAVCGEILETAAAGLGAKAGGGTKLGMLGTLVGAVLGAFVGALIGELSRKEQASAGTLLKSATGAAIGRVLGILGKSGVAAICFCVLLITPFV